MFLPGVLRMPLNQVVWLFSDVWGSGEWSVFTRCYHFRLPLELCSLSFALYPATCHPHQWITLELKVLAIYDTSCVPELAPYSEIK